MQYAQTTLNKINVAVANGAVIVENKNAKYTGRKLGFSRIEKLAHTNSRIHGWPIRIIWACYND